MRAKTKLRSQSTNKIHCLQYPPTELNIRKKKEKKKKKQVKIPHSDEPQNNISFPELII